LMARTRPWVRALAALAILGGLALLASGCEPFSSPQNTFNPAGDVAEKQRWYFLFVMWPALVIGVGVLGACVLIPLRFRRKRGDPGLPKQTHGNTPLELTWTILPALLMVVVGAFTVAGIVDLGREPKADALRVDVTAFQFSWDFQYRGLTDASGQPIFGTIDEAGVPELRIPVDREVGIYVHSNNVIHSFWVPKLAGKIDVIPGHSNRIWIKANKTGVYAGQCAEFCGLDHSFMRLKVIVLEGSEFDAWIAGQQARGHDGAQDGDGGLAVNGE
jgi:cytochrome c oxidase subunit 2